MNAEPFMLALMVLCVFAGILSGLPVMAVLMAVPLLAAFLASLFGGFDVSLLGALPSRFFGIMGNSTLIAIPLFVLMGVILEQSGAGRAMLSAFSRLSGSGNRGLLISMLGMSAVLAATTGVVGASIVMLCVVALPGLLQNGVSKSLASGLVCAGGTLGQIMPPSILIIILSDQISSAYMAGRREAGDFAPEPVSVGDLFGAAILPAILLIVLYGVYLVVAAGKVQKPGPELAGQHQMPESNRYGADNPVWALAPVFLVLVVLGSILFGIATTNEAAAFGVLGAIMLTITMKHTGARLVAIAIAALKETVLMTGMIFGIIFGATTLALVVRGFGGDEMVAEVLSSVPGGETGLLIGVLAIIFLLGFILEFIEIILIIVPLAGPFLFAQGFDPVWVAILISLVLQTSFLTPPFGLALFYFQGANQSLVDGNSGRLDLQISNSTMVRGVMPFVALQALTVIAVFVFPQLATGIGGN